jgi:hypothetical protein
VRTGRFESEGWRIRADGSQFWALAVFDAGVARGSGSSTRATAERHRLDRPNCSRIAVVFAEPQEYVTRINEELASGSPEVTVMDAEGHTLATGRLSISDNQVDLATVTIRLKAVEVDQRSRPTGLPGPQGGCRAERRLKARRRRQRKFRCGSFR